MRASIVLPENLIYSDLHNFHSSEIGSPIFGRVLPTEAQVLVLALWRPGIVELSIHVATRLLL